MTIKQAEYIVTIQQEGSFAAAAQKLFISQPALSQIIKNIETDIGASIFIRRTFPIQLSSAGEKCLETARQILFLDQNLKREIALMKNGSYPILRFGMYQKQPKDLLANILDDYPTELYNLSASIAGSGQLIQMILNSILDIALVSASPIHENLKYLTITEDQLGFIVNRNSPFARKYANFSELPFFYLKDEKFILKFPGNNSRNQFEFLKQKYGISPKIALESDYIDLKSMYNYIGNCISIYPEKSYQRNLWIQEHFHYFSFENEFLPHNFYIVHYKDMIITPEIAHWIELVQSYFQAKNTPH